MSSTDEPTAGQTSEPASNLTTATPPDVDDVDDLDGAAAPERPPVASYLFAADAGAPLRRRPADVWRFLVAGTIYVLLGWAASSRPPLDERTLELFDSVPDWLRVIGWIGYTGAGLAAIGLVIATLLRGGVGRGVFRDVVVSLLVGVGLVVLGARLATGSWPDFLPELFDVESDPAYPTPRTGLVVLVVSAMAPYFTYSVRKLGWWVIVISAVSPILLGLSSITAVLGALALASLSVAIVRLIYGSPEGLPPLGRLVETLERVGVPTTDLAYLPDQPGTVGLATATAADGRSLTIKVYSQDAADRQQSERVWKSMWYRSSGPTPAAGRVQQVEHEALALLVADRADVSVPQVIEAGQDEGGDVLLVVVEPDGTPLGDVPDGELDDATLLGIWRSLGRLQEFKIAHGRIGPTTVRVGAGGPSFVDFNQSSMLPTPQQYGADIASLLGTTAALVGPERAVDIALEGIQRRRLVAALPFLQDACVEPSLRTYVKHSKVKFGRIREVLAERLEVDEPELVSVRRVSVQDLVVVFFMIVAANALISQIAEVGFDTLVDELKTASIGWLIAAFVIKVAGYSTAHIELTAAVAKPLPYAPTAILQPAKSFVGLVVPSSAGTMAVNIRFLQKQGVPTAAAMAQGPLISLVDNAVEIILLLLTGWAMGQAVESDSLGDQGSGGLLAIVGVVIVVGLIVVAVVPKLRAKVWPKVVEAFTAVKDIVSSPSRLGRIFLSETLEKMVGALALGAVVASFGLDVSFTALIFVTVGTSLLAGLAPVPGGIGVAEATMTALLTAVGVPSEQAFSVAIVYRLITSYIPPILGFFSLNWLKDKGYL